MVNAYLHGMDAAEIIRELPNLTGAERQEVLGRLVELIQIGLGFAACPRTSAGEAGHPDRLHDTGKPDRAV